MAHHPAVPFAPTDRLASSGTTRCGVSAGRSGCVEEARLGGVVASTSAGITSPRSRRPACAPTPTRRGSSPASQEVAPARWVDVTAGIQHCSGPLEQDWGFHRWIHRSSRPLTRAGVAQLRRNMLLQTLGDYSVAVDGATGSPEVLQYRFSLKPDRHPRGRLQDRTGCGHSSGRGLCCPLHPPGPDRTDQVGLHLQSSTWLSVHVLQCEVPCPCRPGGVSLSHSRSPSPRRRCASWARSTAVEAA